MKQQWVKLPAASCSFSPSKRDEEIIRLRREMDRAKYDTDGEASESLTEPDTDGEEQLRTLGMIWTGCYLLDLESPPSIPEIGWAVGKGPSEDTAFELLLCTRPFAKSYNVNLRNPHARINFFVENKGLYIVGCSRSTTAQLSVDGNTAMQRPYHLNQHKMTILLDKLEYHFQWNKSAATDDFLEARRLYVSRSLGGPAPAIVDVEMPTPLPNKRTMGMWTLGDALGAGGQGKVFFASNHCGDVAAIKVLKRTRHNGFEIRREIETLREVAKLARNPDEGERILHITEVLYSRDEELSPKVAFDDVAIVLKPMTPRTFSDLVGNRSKGGCKGMTIEAANAFRSALLGIKVMHDGGWLHGDLKPGNIGLIGRPLRSVLLDLGMSAHVPECAQLQHRPGTVGTIGYLAPELELQHYDHSIDIWSMGVILFELTYGSHPWRFSVNPWRAGKENEKLRASFHTNYQNAIAQMARDYSNANASPTSGLIHLGELFIEMVRHPWAMTNHGQRLKIDEVLEHPAWGSLLAKSPPAKRRRLEHGR